MTAIFCVVLGHIGGITSIPWLVEIIYSYKYLLIMFKLFYFIYYINMTAIFFVFIVIFVCFNYIGCLVEIIYSFHMALFFAASSYVLAINGRVLSNKRRLNNY